MAPPPRRICLHNCHKKLGKEARVPQPLRNIHVFLNAAGGLDREAKLHSCTPANPCPGSGYRSFVPADWVKFGGALYEAAHRGSASALDIKERFEKSWRCLYEGNPPLTPAGGPVNFMDDPTVLPSLDIPWFAYPTSPAEDRPETPLEDPSSRTLEALLQDYQPRYNLGQPFPRLLDFAYDTAEHCENVAPRKKMRAVCILSKLHSIVEAGPLDAYAQYAILEQADYDEIFKVHPDCIKLLDRKNDKEVQVLAQMFVLLGVEMKESPSRFEVKYMHFDEYHQALEKRDSTTWRFLQSADLVIGGVEFGDNFFGQGQLYYGLKPAGMLAHWDGLMALKKETLIWPDPIDLFRQGSKLHVASLVQAVAKSENQQYPICATVKPTPQLVKDIVNGTRKGVLKREWSTGTDHVYYKGMPMDRVDIFKNQLTSRTKLEKQLAKQKPHDLLNVTPKWFIQPFIPSLIYVGELRVLIVNGAILGKIITTPTGEHGPEYIRLEEPFLVTPLSMIKKFISGESHHRPNTNILSANHLSSSIYAKNIEDSYAKFALRTLSKVILAEEHVTKRRSDLRIFTRLDMTVISTGDNQCQFLVNEVTRGHNMGTWGQLLERSNEILVQELAHVLHFVAYEFKKAYRN